MQVQIAATTVKTPFVPDEATLQKCREMGETLSRQIAEKLN